MAWIRKSKPKKSEITCYCSETDRPFVMILEHDEDNHWDLPIVGIKRIEEKPSKRRSLIPRLRKSAAQTINSHDINWDKFYCPWCGADEESNLAPYVHCGDCNRLFCSHGLVQKQKGKWWNGHPSCRRSAGYVERRDNDFASRDAKKPPTVPKDDNTPIPPPDRLKITYTSVQITKKKK